MTAPPADRRDEVLDYFRDRADTYDLVEQQAYWRLSDALLWEALRTGVLEGLPPAFRFLDAGGGTGRWSLRLLSEYPQSTGVLYDLSPDMIGQARRKLAARADQDRLALVNGDLMDVGKALEAGSFDLIINLHNVLGFVPDPAVVIAQLAALLRRGGSLVSFAPNRYHAAFFNLLHSRTEEADRAIREGVGRFTSEMPAIHLFTPSQLRLLYEDSGLAVDLLSGFPVLMYPGMRETQPTGTSATIGRTLMDGGFAEVLELEKALLREPETATRGNNLFIAGHRP